MSLFILTPPLGQLIKKLVSLVLAQDDLGVEFGCRVPYHPALRTTPIVPANEFKCILSDCFIDFGTCTGVYLPANQDQGIMRLRVCHGLWKCTGTLHAHVVACVQKV